MHQKSKEDFPLTFREAFTLISTRSHWQNEKIIKTSHTCDIHDLQEKYPWQLLKIKISDLIETTFLVGINNKMFH